MRIGTDALDWARGQHDNPSRDWTRDCQMFVRSSFGIGGLYGSAISAFYNTNRRHTSWPPPRAVPCWYAGGSYGHVTLSLGDGTCWSNDYVRRGRIDRIRIYAPVNGWNYRYLGWSEDINEQRIWFGGQPLIDVSQIIWGVRHHKKVDHGIALKKAVAAEVGKGTMLYANHVLGDGFRRQYKKLQIKWYGEGDGIPGPTSLERLGSKHGLDVRP